MEGGGRPRGGGGGGSWGDAEHEGRWGATLGGGGGGRLVGRGEGFEEPARGVLL